MSLPKTSVFLALGLAALACGGKATRDGQGNGRIGTGGNGVGGDVHEHVSCATSAECGSLTCLCGTCVSACDGAFDCALPAETACVGDGPSASAPTGSNSFAIRPGPFQGNDLALGPDASLFVVGGAAPVSLDLGSVVYRAFWLTRLDAQGTSQWEVVEVQDDTLSPGLSVAFDGETLSTLSTVYVEGERTLVRLFDARGLWIGETHMEPELTVARAMMGNPGVWQGGSELVSTTGGRPFLRAQIGRSGGARSGTWLATFAGSTGSLSAVVDLAPDESGNVSSSGYLGIDAESNRSVPWVARVDANGETLF